MGRVRDRYGGYISAAWLERRARAYAHAGETPPPIVVDERGIAREVRADTRGGHSLTSFDRAAQQYFDPPDPKEYTYAVTISMDITATSEDDADRIVKQLMEVAGHSGLINDWYVEDMHPYGPEVDMEEEPPEVGE
jgi:hypothetical protein